MSDMFEEIRSDLEQEKWVKLWKKYHRHLSTALIIIAIATAALLFMQRRSQSVVLSQSNDYIQALYLMDQGQTDAALQKFERIPMQGESVYAQLARLWVASMLATKGDDAGAASIYRKVIDETKGFLGMGSMPSIYNLALIKWAYLVVDTEDAASVLSQISSLTGEENPWRFSAWELSGLLKDRLNDPRGAKVFYEKILKDPETPTSFRIKAQALLNVLPAA